MYAILIKNGNLIDGTGSPAIAAELAIKDGKIVKIARLYIHARIFLKLSSSC